MRRALICSLALSLAACGGSGESTVTETRMDDIDSLQGTISDEMVNTDELNEQALVEAAPAATAKPKAKSAGDAKPEAKAAAAPAAEAPATAGDE
jgi:hypothetical protein